MKRDPYISPSFRLSEVDPCKWDDQIKIYDDRVRGWQLNPARALLNVPQANLAMLQILLPYFESFEIYRSGEDSERRSKEFFRRGFLAVFPQAQAAPWGESFVDTLYSQARNGLFHDGLTRYRIDISRGAHTALVPQLSADRDVVERILINPAHVLAVIQEHHKNYVASLRDASNGTLREHFRKAWRFLHDPSR